MVTLTSAQNALKTVYLGVVSDQLNISANPLLGKIKQTSNDVWGKEIRKLAPYGVNGGVGAGTEDGSLPNAAGNNYVQFVSKLKNLYGTIEISDKAIRASANNSGAFVNLLNAEMEGLIKASSFNLGRMIYGDGSGLLATVVSAAEGAVVVDSVKNLMEGMVIDVYNGNSKVSDLTGIRIVSIDRTTKAVKFGASVTAEFAKDYKFYVQNSKGEEITGLGKIFGSAESLYEVSRTDHPWMNPYIQASAGEISDTTIQTAIDFLEEVSGSAIDFITCSAAIKRAYQQYLGSYRRNIDVTELQGGYKALTYNGIPLVSDRFVDEDTMYLLNTKEFTLHQLCDWKWLEGDDGRILKQKQGYPTYSATLVKYADLICNKPNGQAKISGILGTVENPFKPVVNVTVNPAEA